MKFIFKFILVTSFFISLILCKNDSEFVIKPSVAKVSTSKLKESVVDNFADILKLDIKLDKLSLNLREEVQNQLEICFNQTSHLNSFSKDELSEAVQELENLKENLNISIVNIEKSLKKLKKLLKF